MNRAATERAATEDVATEYVVTQREADDTPHPMMYRGAQRAAHEAP